MTTRTILAEAKPLGHPCGHCRTRGTCGCDVCVQGGGVCGECGGLRYFVPPTTISMDEFDPPREEPLARVVLARRPKKPPFGRRVARR
ncbi:MAG: hypothetical protein WC445_04090 [Patescibacteria group bacterium]